MSVRDFGFYASEQRGIDLDRDIPPELETIFQKEPSLRNCIACGNCAALCTAGSYTGMQFYRLNIMAGRGLLREMAQKAEVCMLCGKCQMACPRGVNIRHGILLMAQL
jgi:heterodisulfide reductase subunit C